MYTLILVRYRLGARVPLEAATTPRTVKAEAMHSGHQGPSNEITEQHRQIVYTHKEYTIRYIAVNALCSYETRVQKEKVHRRHNEEKSRSKNLVAFIPHNTFKVDTNRS